MVRDRQNRSPVHLPTFRLVLHPLGLTLRQRFSLRHVLVHELFLQEHDGHENMLQGLLVTIQL